LSYFDLRENIESHLHGVPMLRSINVFLKLK
jgi:hypothetical protein